MTRIPPRSGIAFKLLAGQSLKVVDPFGEQVADVIAFSTADKREVSSSGRTLDYAETVRLTTGNVIYSSRSRPMLTITEDSVGRHDFLLTPCSADTFRIIYGYDDERPSCQRNLELALAEYGIDTYQIGTTFNVFMNVEIDCAGRLRVLAPLSRAGDHVTFRAEMDLLVGITACSAEMSNNYKFKPIDFEVIG